MDKQAWRKYLITQLKQLSTHKKVIYEQAIHQRILNSTLWDNASIVGITYAQIFEWNTIPLVNNALENGKTITFPKANPKTREMDFYAINQIDELKPGYAGSYEPDPEITTYKNKSKIDLLIVIDLVFDENGFWIGFGGVFYDRFLEDYQRLTVSLAAEFQIVKKLPRQTFDKSIKHIITDKRHLRTYLATCEKRCIMEISEEYSMNRLAYYLLMQQKYDVSHRNNDRNEEGLEST